MMYDHEKSDPAIVAVKPTNKAGQPAAELVEPRAGAEGNVSQQSTGRAQYRGTVSQAPKRIRNFLRISRRRYIPEVGAVCPNWARTDLMAWTGRAPSALWLKEGGSAIHAVPRTEAPSAAA